MSDLAIALIAVGAWLATGLVTAWWMARRGYRRRGWLYMGAVFGPVLALAADERIQRNPGQLGHVEHATPRPGGPQVLVGVDGSAESQEALELAVRLLGPHAGSLVAAEVVGYDAAEDGRGPDVVAAERHLNTVAERSGGRVTACELLSGPPAQALAGYAAEQQVDLIVVGRHGRGFSKRLLGSVAQELLHHGTVPVLVTGRRPHTSGR